MATQLFTTGDPLTFTAPNLQYLMDSPIEFSDHQVRTFTLVRQTQKISTNGNQGTVEGSAAPVRIRVSMHHTGTDAELDAFTKDVEKIAEEQVAVFGDIPVYDNGYYTFLADYLPWGGGDGMEHRNSTVIASTATLASNRMGLLGTASHEFFHSWNVERIRPKTLEPFSFEDANISGELWLAEGFTNYYGRLTMLRAGLREDTEGVGAWAGVINGVNNSPGTKFRSAVEMSRLAPFVDAAVSIDSTYWQNTFYSYYTFGEAIALGLDLTLRDRSDSKITLDDYMRAMWTTHGKPGGPAPGLVAKPYTLADARARLAEVSRRQGVRRRLLHALHRGDGESRLREADGARRVPRAARGARPRDARHGARRCAQRSGASRRAVDRRLAALCRRSRSRRRDRGDWRHEGFFSGRHRQGARVAQAGRRGDDCVHARTAPRKRPPRG